MPGWIFGAEEVPDPTQLALAIARAGAAGGGVSRDGFRRVCGLSPNVPEDLLRALVATGQVEMVLTVGGQMSVSGGGVSRTWAWPIPTAATARLP